jgi:hypothetical protein
MGRDAFTKADATARMAIQLTRPLLHSGLEDPEAYISTNYEDDSRYPFTVNKALVQNNFTLSKMELNLVEDGTEQAAIDRQMAAMTTDEPHLIIQHEGEIVGTATVAISYLKAEAGESVAGDNQYGGTPPPQRAAIMVISTGRVPVSGEVADAGYFTGSENAPSSVISTVYKDIVQ